MRLSGFRVIVIRFDNGFADGPTLEFVAASVVDDAVEDGICESRFNDDVMPGFDRELTGDHY